MAAPALAALPPDLSRQAEAIQRQQQERIEQDQTRILSNPRGQTVIEVPTHPTAVAPPGSCRDIGKITFTTAPNMTPADEARLTKPYLGRCLGLGDVENLLSDITRFYVDRAQPTTRVYIKPQNLVQGELVLEIVEGRVERVILEDGGRHSLNLRTAFGARENTVFNLRIFEQGLDQVNRLSSNHATLDIRPGSKPGDSVVVIRNQPTFPLHLGLSYDNTGQASTGRDQGAASVILDNALRLNDQLSYTRRQSIGSRGPNADSSSNSVLWSVPYNALTLTAGYSDSAYRSQSVTSGGTVFVLRGTTRNIFTRLEDAVWRDARSKLTLSATLTQKKNRNYVGDTRLAVSSRTLTVLDLGAEYVTLIGNGSLRLNGGWSRGLHTLGALGDGPSPAAGSPRAQFDKLTASAYLSLPFNVAGRAVLFTSEVDGQYGFDPLYSSEQIVVGSPYTVRGFHETSLTGDRGVYAQNNLSTGFRVQAFKQPIYLRPRVGIDLGDVGRAGYGGASGFVASGTLGLGVAAGPVSIDLYASRAFSRAGLADEGTLAFVRAAVNF